MSESSELERSKLPKHLGRRHIRSAFGVAAILIMFGIGAFISWELLKIHRHQEASHRMQIAITRLAFHRPENLTDDQWAYCILRTCNLHGNYGGHWSYVPTNDLERIVDEFEGKIDAGPDLNTIDWLWDDYYAACPRSRNYENWRPTTADNREQFEAGAHGGYPLSYWQAEFKRLVSQ